MVQGVALGKTFTNLNPGGLQETGEPLDFGIAGSGFFAVQSAQGVRYTRDGQFTTSATGQLTDANGNPVLGQGGAPIQVPAGGHVPASALGVFELTGAAKQGENLFTGTSAGKATGTVRQGALEGSSGGRREGDGRHDLLAAQLPIRPAGDPGDRPDAAGRLDPGRLAGRLSGASEGAREGPALKSAAAMPITRTSAPRAGPAAAIVLHRHGDTRDRKA